MIVSQQHRKNIKKKNKPPKRLAHAFLILRKAVALDRHVPRNKGCEFGPFQKDFFFIISNPHFLITIIKM